jgi:hypothetical protein
MARFRWLRTLTGWVLTVATVAAAAVNRSISALFPAAAGGIIVQFACSMWIEGRIGRIMQVGLGFIGHAHEMLVPETHANDICAMKWLNHKVRAYETHACKIHAREAHAHEVYA